MKPEIIIITGAPGSGKSTLAKSLSENLYGYTHIDPDDVLQSFWEQSQNDPSYDREEVGVPNFKLIVELLLKNKVRLIIDMQADANFMKSLNLHHSLLNIHCIADNPAQRFYRREVSPDGTEPDWLHKHMPEIKRLEKVAREPIDVGQKILRAECNNGYIPIIEEIIKEIEN